MTEMSAEEVWNFLMEGTRTSHVATVRADGLSGSRGWALRR
jgi:hypothetical protein